MSLIPSFLSLFLFSLTILAGPIERRAISPSLLQTLNLYEQYAAAAYCPGNNNSPNTKIICSSDNCPLVQAANTDSIIEFQDTTATDTTGYLATDTTNSLIVLSYRGSESIRNYITDLTFTLIPAPTICASCKADQGFWTAWSESRDMVLAAVKAAKTANPGFKIVATGHSLGGAIATFAAAELRNAGYSVDLVTFGSPRVGDPTTASYISGQTLGASYRVTHLNDLVPRLPPESFGYKHVSPEYYISSGNNQPVTANDVSQCDGCNENWVVTDILAHAWYFNAISACYPGDTVEVKMV